MTLLKDRLAATKQKLNALKEARKASDKARRKAYKESKADQARTLALVGEAVLRRVERGEMDEADFRQMMFGR
ncbi:hypothetical protein [Paraburkholderia youngii]|uniref:Uncharacterized protein n=1 Tax=Paraburkholderia youngii TaxID=2782701 RepID=A0A7Y6K9J0_9BURK|nr:hypothetical protein [Paraburkholderia youngii]NUY06084.1 hypothetical protein [Paraburkholderia youngii]